MKSPGFLAAALPGLASNLLCLSHGIGEMPSISPSFQRPSGWPAVAMFCKPSGRPEPSSAPATVRAWRRSSCLCERCGCRTAHRRCDQQMPSADDESEDFMGKRSSNLAGYATRKIRVDQKR
jgi:hypothetical protein